MCRWQVLPSAPFSALSYEQQLLLSTPFLLHLLVILSIMQKHSLSLFYVPCTWLGLGREDSVSRGWRPWTRIIEESGSRGTGTMQII